MMASARGLSTSKGSSVGKSKPKKASNAGKGRISASRLASEALRPAPLKADALMSKKLSGQKSTAPKPSASKQLAAKTVSSKLTSKKQSVEKHATQKQSAQNLAVQKPAEQKQAVSRQQVQQKTIQQKAKGKAESGAASSSSVKTVAKALKLEPTSKAPVDSAVNHAPGRLSNDTVSEVVPSHSTGLANGKSATAANSASSVVRQQRAKNAAGASEGKPAKEAKERRSSRNQELSIDREKNIEAQWQALFEKQKAVKAIPYKMSNSYEALTPLIHSVLGWGYILSCQNNRLEVIFKNGIKILVANYKAS